MVLTQHSLLETRLSDSSREVNRLRKHLDQVRMEAMTDALTNLANRKSFDEALDGHCDGNDDKALTLAVVDIDHFKRFNDTWGHQTGDQVLRYVASVLARIGRPPRLAARYGGEEFGLLFPGESAVAVERILNEARQEIASRVLKRRSTNEDLGAVTISAGIAQREFGEDGFDLVDRADKALYESKNNGRNKVTVAAPSRAASSAA
jgi:diguanylate cyclase